MKALQIVIVAMLTSCAAFFQTGCATSSSLATGKTHYPSTQADQIQILTEYPDQYETIGLLEASAPKGYLRKPKHATQLAIASLKKEAANLGAHAVVLKDYSSEKVPDFSLGGNDELGLLFNTEHKIVTAVAIRLK